jgi:hypothetical protein
MGQSSFREREKICSDGFGFQCKCKLCELDRKDVDLQRREVEIEEKAKKLATGMLNPFMKQKEVTSFLHEVERIYKRTEARPDDLKFSTFLPMMLQAQMFRKKGELDGAVETFLKIYHRFHFTMIHFALVSLFEAVQICFDRSMNDKAVEYLRTARQDYIGDVANFEFVVERRFPGVEF